jgi:hypothetical protein
LTESALHKWIDRYIRAPLSFGYPLPRFFGITILNRSLVGKDRYWNILQFALPGEADCLWRNGLVSFYVHFPFGFSLSIRLPIPYGGRRFGWTLQTGIGWKGYNGKLMGTFRIQNDDHPDYHNPQGSVGRAKGLDEGRV